LPRVRATLKCVMKLRTLLLETRPDALLSFISESNLLTILAGIGLKTRVIVSERIQPSLHTSLPRVWRILRRVLYVLADDVVAQTRDAAQWLESHCRTSVSVIPNALRLLPEPSDERRSVIVAVGRLTHQKGFDVLLRAFARIASRFEEWSLVIIGEGDERLSLTRLRGELRLDDRVEFVGQTPNVVDWMAHAGLVVQTSRFEGFPNVVLESMGLGAAVISTDCRSGPSDMIEDGVNGRLVPVDDVDTLVDVMAELISRPEERERLGRAASGVRERYRQDIVMERWEACLFPQPAKREAPREKHVSKLR
jgi:GalNAc-alpha-(1->4)-GalNAc-alpha-(1->3)-diNAcBac-PP-undecaprenol alpha-1,4-N-acetyl-D-galactosaminyltransferase